MVSKAALSTQLSHIGFATGSERLVPWFFLVSSMSLGLLNHLQGHHYNLIAGGGTELVTSWASVSRPPGEAAEAESRSPVLCGVQGGSTGSQGRTAASIPPTVSKPRTADGLCSLGSRLLWRSAVSLDALTTGPIGTVLSREHSEHPCHMAMGGIVYRVTRLDPPIFLLS